MKKLRVYIILALAISFIIMMPFSIVLGANPIIVRNQATIIKPYETGYRDYGKTGGSRADANADYDTIDGRVFVFATASDVSNAWANASLEDDFEILHTSNYRITFSFNYKGLVEITGFDFLVPDFDLASVRIDLKVYLIDTSDRSIVSQRTRTIYQEDYSISNLPPSFPSYSVELADSIDVVLLPSLDESHAYDWRAELRTEVSATEDYGNDLQVTADFFSSDYGANIMQVRVVDLIPDNSPPVTTPVLSGTEGENGWYTSSVTVSLSAIDTGYGVENITYKVGDGSENLYRTPIIIGTEGTNTIEYYSVDKANNIENPKTLSIEIDSTQPTGQVVINNDDEYVTSEGVMLHVAADDGEGSGLYQMRFRNQEDSWSDTWIDYTTEPISWTLGTGDGYKVIYAQFKDNAGNISPPTFDTIFLDIEPPNTTSSFDGNEGEDGWYTSDVTIELIATDTASGVDYTNYRVNGVSWNNYAMPFIIGTEGTNTIEYYSVDKANNYEIKHTKSFRIDKARPTGTITINGGDIYTSSTSVTLSLTYADTVSGVYQVRYGNDAVLDSQPWEDPAGTKEWTLSSGEGTKTVYWQIKDKAGNISPLQSDDIILDTDPPSAAIEINDGDEYTNSTTVTLFLQYSDNLGVSQVRYRNYGDAYTEWEDPSDTKDWILITGDETKTVYAQVRDQSGLTSEIFDTIILDTVPPIGSIKINNGDLDTTSTSVTITPIADDVNGVIQMRLRNEGGDWNDWEEVTTKAWTLTSGYGTKTVFAQFKDVAGSVSPLYNATINFVENVNPTPSSAPSEKGKVIIYVRDENNNSVLGATVASTTQPTGQSPLVGTTDSLGTVTFDNILAGSYSFRASKGGYGSDNVQVIVQNQQTVTVKTTLFGDLSKPTVSLSISPENSAGSQRVFSIMAEDDAQGSGISTVTLYIDEIPIASWTTAGTHIYDEGVYSKGTHTYYVTAVDNAGNTARNPVSGYLEFLVEEDAQSTQIELWKILSIILVLAGGSVLALLSLKLKK